MSGALSKLGIYLGETDALFPGNKWNEPGYFEHSDIVNLNDELLKAAGSAWDAPPPLGTEWDALLSTADPVIVARAQKIVQSLESRAISNNTTWAFKDPRTALTWGFWQRFLAAPKIILCVRSPTNVAQSLIARHDVSSAFGFRLCGQYFDRLLTCVSGHPTKLVEYGSFIQRPRETLLEVCAWLQISPEKDALDSAVASIKPDLAHHRLLTVSEELHSEVWQKYRQLLASGVPSRTGITTRKPPQRARFFAPWTGDQLDFADMTPLKENSSWSVVAQICPVSTNNYSGIISKRTAFETGANQFTFWLRGGLISIEADAYSRVSSLRPPLNQWSIVGASADTNGTTFYMGNNETVSIDTGKGLETGTVTNSLPLIIGRLGNNFSGSIASISIYSGKIEEPTMRGLCQGNIDPQSVPGLVFMWAPTTNGDVDSVTGGIPKIKGTYLHGLDELSKSSQSLAVKSPISSKTIGFRLLRMLGWQ